MKTLRISPDLALPAEIVTETLGILAKKGAGKSNAAVVLAEEMHDAGVPWVAIDPKGDWWGVRSSADGKSAGLPVVVFGGKHGDVPLEPTAGALIADLILGDDGRGYLSCVLDVSQLTISDQRRFLLDFGERLFRRKDEDRVLHLFLEEAHEYLPQSVPRESTRLVSTWQRIVKQGRFKGLGVTLVSQRSAALNKDVLTQADSLLVLRTMSPQDRAAVKGWVEVHAGASEVLQSLPQLAPGEAWLWSPEHFADPQRFRWRRRRTFDSGATPKIGQTRIVPRTLTDVDHANHETLDNRRANLRITTHALNVRNRYGPTIAGTSGYIGVSLHRASRHRVRPWSATVKAEGRRTTVGYYATPEQAALARDAWIREHHPSEFWTYNFPRPGERGIDTTMRETA